MLLLLFCCCFFWAISIARTHWVVIEARIKTIEFVITIKYFDCHVIDRPAIQLECCLICTYTPIRFFIRLIRRLAQWNLGGCTYQSRFNWFCLVDVDLNFNGWTLEFELDYNSLSTNDHNKASHPNRWNINFFVVVISIFLLINYKSTFQFKCVKWAGMKKCILECIFIRQCR